MDNVPRKYPNRIAEILERITISQVRHALGGGELKRNRGKAFWRNGDGWNVSINEAKQAWYDHRDAEGGGIIDLIKRVLRCDGHIAAQWLSDLSGIPLRKMSADERWAWQKACQQAEAEARALQFWKADMLTLLRDYRKQLQDTVLTAQRWGLKHISDSRYDNDPRWEACWWAASSLADRVEQIHEEIDRLESTSYAELLPYFRKRQRQEAAA